MRSSGFKRTKLMKLGYDGGGGGGLSEHTRHGWSELWLLVWMGEGRESE